VTAVTSVFRPEIAKLAKIIKLTMVDSDEDFSLGEEDEYTESDGCTKKHALEDIGPERAAKSVRSKSPKASNQTRALMPSTLEVLLPMEREASLLLQGIDYDRNTSARIIVASLRFQKEYLLKKSKNKCKNTPAPEVRNTVCRMLGVSPKVYTKIMSGYILHRSVYASGLDGQGRGGNSGAKSSRIPRTKSVSIAVREFVRGERKLQKLVTGREVLDFFIKEGILCIPMDPKMGVFVKKDFQTASRNVRRYLQDYGYRRGRRNNIAPNQSMIAKRHEYVQALFTNEALPKGERLRNVYMDESCIHEHYNKNDRSVWDPKDVLDIQHGKSKHKGRRYCFAAAIQGPDPFVDVPELASEKAGLVPGTIWAFCPQKKGSDQGDYHKVFNGENFVTWWKNQLLPNLHQPCLIHMDNAAYHKVYGSHVPKCGKMRKQECIDYLHSKGIETEAECSAVVLKVRCYSTLPCGMSLGQLPLGKESVSVSQSNGRSGYVSHMEFVSALLRKSTIFELPCCGLPPCDMSCGNYPLNTDVASVNQNYAHGVKEARTEVIPKPCSVTTWTRNNRSVCTIAMFLEAHVFSLYLSVYKTKMSWDTSGY
jgi:hypothetical protein